MKAVLVHLTDLHITTKNTILEKIEPLLRTLKDETSGECQLIFLITGDIVNTGKNEEYAIAHKFFSNIRLLLHSEKKFIKIEFIFVPGNHDCNFSENTQLRELLLNNISYSSINKDESVINACLNVQDNFWSFYKSFQTIPEDKLYYRISVNIGKKNLAFHCINTAWMSHMKEQVGNLFYPVHRYSKLNVDDSAINFSLWHHPTNWLNPNTLENNKDEFENFVNRIASTHFFGHEHTQKLITNQNLLQQNKANYFAGEIFHEDNKPNKSGFHILIIEEEANSAIVNSYTLNPNNNYSLLHNSTINFDSSHKKLFKINNEFIKELEQVKIPLIIENRATLRLPEIYIFPDLEPLDRDSDKIDIYISSALLINETDKTFVLDGESQIGKSSLLSMYYIKSYEKGYYPIYLKTRDLNSDNFDRQLKKAFIDQYGSKENFDLYNQTIKDKKILILDDFHECAPNLTQAQNILNIARIKFGKIFVSIDSSNSILSRLRLEDKQSKYYSIKPFGFKRRNELIEKYLTLLPSTSMLENEAKLELVKNIYNSLQEVLGDRLLPAYPVFLLSIIQALQYKPIQQTETSFGYCYQTLITYSLIKSGVKTEEIDSYFNILSEFAYHFIDKELEEISSKKLNTFFLEYATKYICPSYEEVIVKLKKSNILRHENDNYAFTYNYILYYLSAKKIGEEIHKDSGKKMINKLFSDLHLERNANVLVFVTHHSKDISFIEETLLRSMILFESSAPIQLDRKDKYYDDLKLIADTLKNEIIDSSKDPIREREKLLEESDRKEIERNIKEEEIKEEEINELIRPFIQSARSIEIIGQIIKNRKGSLEKGKLSELVKEIYISGFRSISNYSELLGALKNELTASLERNLEISKNRVEIESKILGFLQILSFRFCLGVFSKLTLSIGTKELKEIYNDVATEINSPAAKLVTFSINSYYGNVSVSEVRKLADEFKDNVVALKILRSRVRFYVYNRNLDYSTKQRLASAVQMEIIHPNKNQNI